jgi:hypothetical protein
MCKLRKFKLTALLVLLGVFLESYTSIIQVLFLSLALALVSTLVFVCCVVVLKFVLFVARQFKSIIVRVYDSFNVNVLVGIKST